MLVVSFCLNLMDVTTCLQEFECGLSTAEL